MSYNYYILLGLDPTVDDWTVIEAKIKDCQRRWSMQKNQGAPKDKRNAERFLKLIPYMQDKLSDPATRRAIAHEAETKHGEQKAELFSQLDELIGMIKGPSFESENVKILVQAVGGAISELEVITRLQEKGITVAGPGPATGTPTERPRIDSTTAESIRDNLRHLKLKSLYDFLGMGPNSSPTSLYDTADQVYKELRRKGLTDPDSTSRQELAGHAKAVFKDSSWKERYDNTYADEAMENFNSHLEIAGRDSFLDQDEVDRIVREARSKGVSQEVAIEYIEEFAKKRRWKIQRTTDLPSAELKQCGFCNTIARTPQDIRCLNCGEELVQPCPHCKQLKPTQYECCEWCGCSTGDAPIVHGLLREGQEHLAQGNLSEAQSSFERALLYWKNWQPAIDGQKDVEAARNARESALEAIDHLQHARKLEQALSALDRFRREFGPGGTEALRKRIEEGIARAQMAFRDATALRRAGKAEVAFDKLTEALGFCSDFQPALHALASSPPPAPSGLKVTLDGATAQLSWSKDPAQGRVSYRILRKTSGAPMGPKDGIAIGEVQTTTCKDTSVPPGIPLYYSVFAIRAGVPSAVAASSGPHLRLADPEEVTVEAGDCQAIIRWKRPNGCSSVEVWRERGHIPTAPGMGSRVTVSGDSVDDRGLMNGTLYGYLIVACFTDPANARAVIRAPGVAVEATPVALPPAVQDLRARREDRTVILQWTPPALGEVQIRQTRLVPTHTLGRIIPMSNADQIGTPVRAVGRSKAQTTIAGQGRIFFIPLSVVSQTAVLGTPIAVTTLDPVANLQSERQGDVISLTWDWPAGAAEALVAWDHDSCPESPEDMRGGRRVVTHSEYDRHGLWALRKAAHARHCFTVFVRDHEADIYSPGATVIEASGLEAQVTYTVLTRRSMIRRTVQDAWIELRTRDNVHTLPALLVVLKQGIQPLRPDDGQTLVSLEHLTFENGTARIDLPPNGASGYVKLFFKDGRHARGIRLLPADMEQLRIE